MPPEQILSELLQVPFCRGYGGVMFNVRKNCYTVSTWHNTKKPDKFQWIESSLNFYEHKHLNGYERNPILIPNKFTKKWIVRDRLEVQAGSFLTIGGYALDRGYKPVIPGCHIVELSGIKNEWRMTVFENVNDFIRFIVK